MKRVRIRPRAWLCAGLLSAAAACADTLRIKDDAAAGALTILDGATTPILSYQYRDTLAPGFDAKHRRSCYIHPLYSLDGQTLTDDFPKDHPHHRGVFWTWPVVKVRDRTTQTWHPQDPPLQQRFVRWKKREADDTGAVIEAENVWLFDDQEDVARETVTIHARPETSSSRTIDVEIKLEAIGGSLTLEGQPEGRKGYGGFCLRAAPWFAGARLLSSDGAEKADLTDKPLLWADLSITTSGVSIFASPDHPASPVRWFARNSYAGFLNPSWPGLTSVTLEPGKPVTLRYGLLVHRGDAATVEASYATYARR
jgi:hypothetical protein